LRRCVQFQAILDGAVDEMSAAPEHRTCTGVDHDVLDRRARVAGQQATRPQCGQAVSINAIEDA